MFLTNTISNCILNIAVSRSLPFTTLGSELVDLRLSDVGTLLSLLQLMLNLPELGHVGVELLLLCDIESRFED